MVESPKVIQAEVNVVILVENGALGLSLFSFNTLSDISKTGYLCEFNNKE